MSGCKLGQLLHTLPEGDAGLLALLLDGEPDERGRDVSAAALSRALRAMGHDVGPTTVKDHRGLRCACNRGRTA